MESVSDEVTVAINLSLWGTRWSDLMSDALRQMFNQDVDMREKISVANASEFRGGCRFMWDRVQKMVAEKALKAEDVLPLGLDDY